MLSESQKVTTIPILIAKCQNRALFYDGLYSLSSSPQGIWPTTGRAWEGSAHFILLRSSIVISRPLTRMAPSLAKSESTRSSENFWIPNESAIS